MGSDNSGARRVIDLLHRRDEEGLRLLLREQGHNIETAVRRRFEGLLDENEVEDAISRMLQVVWDKRDEFDGPPAKLFAWCVAIAVNAGREVARRKIRHRMPAFSEAMQSVHTPDPGPSPSCLALFAALQEAVETLSGNARAVVEANLQPDGGPSDAEIADQLSIERASVPVIRCKALKRIRDVLTSRGHFVDARSSV